MRILLGLLGILLLTNCQSMPIVGSLTGNGVTAAVTGQIEKSVASTVVDIAVHDKTGKTPSQHILAKLTKEKYEQVTVMYEEFKDKALVAFEHKEQFHASP